MNDEQQTKPEPIEAAPVLMPIAAVRLALQMVSGADLEHAMVNESQTLGDILRATIAQGEALPTGFDEFGDLARRLMLAGRKACENLDAGKVEIRMSEDRGVTYLVLSIEDTLTSALAAAVAVYDRANGLEPTSEGEEAAARVTEALAGEPGTEPS